jgi:hypothetical protein
LRTQAAGLILHWLQPGKPLVLKYRVILFLGQDA